MSDFLPSDFLGLTSWGLFSSANGTFLCQPRCGATCEKLGCLQFLSTIPPKIARRLKGLARELDVPVLCLAQVNRQAEDSREHHPRLSHLRESGAIEQDAEVVMFVHREEYFRRGEKREQFAGQAEIIIAKQRNGPTGEVELVWRKQFTRFEDKAPERLEEFDANSETPDGADF